MLLIKSDRLLVTESTSREGEATISSTPSEQESVSTELPLFPEVPGKVIDQPTSDSSPAPDRSPAGLSPLAPEYPAPTSDVVTELPVPRPPPGDTVKPQGEPTISSPTPPIPSFNRLDERLHSFDAFRQAFWLNSSGQVVEAPWRDRECFTAELTQALHQALDHREFGRAFLFVQALDNLIPPKEWVLDDWRCAETISESPAAISSGFSYSRTQRLRSTIGGVSRTEDLRLALFLEAVRPNPESTFSPRDLEWFMEKLPFHDQNLAEVVAYLFQGNVAGIDPLAVLKAQMAHGREMNRVQLEAELKQHCRQLRTHIAQIWSAAGGRIQHTHCRNAWKKFMEHIIEPLRDQMLVTDDPGKLIAQLPELRTRLRRLMKAYAQIMDDAEVGKYDRKTTDRAANELASMFKDIVDGAERLQTLANSTTPTTRPVPTKAVRHLLDPSIIFQSVEELCRQIFLCLMECWTGCRPLRMDARLLRDKPALLGEMDPEALREFRFVRDGLPVNAFRPPHLAAAAILSQQPIYYDTPVATEDDLLAEIREHALEAYAHRPDLLSCLSTLPRPLLESSDRNRLHRFASDLGDEVFRAAETLTALARQCHDLDLVAPMQTALQPTIEAARHSADAGITHVGLTDGLLLRGWIDYLICAVTGAKDCAIASYRQAISDQNPDRIVDFEEAIAHNDLRRIPLLLSGYELINSSSLPELRRTPWRTLERIREIASCWIDDVEQHHKNSGEEIRELITLWISPSGNPNTRQKFRRLFYRLISGEEGIGYARRKRVFPDGLVRGGFDGTAVHIQCRVIRKMFRQNGLNPTFLPQLADYAEIVLLSPPLSNLRGGGMAADWSRSVTAEGSNALVVFLAPKINPTQRREILSEFRTRNRSAALIDDFDFWRLAMVDDHDFVPFLEIVMEQLKLERISPFSSQDGQNVRLETYVGRKEQAESLAKTAHYSQVFSGRKLGKSALLKQVEIVYDHSRLPSGNRLNVLFVTIAGGDSEAWIVNQIIAEMSHRFGLVEPASSCSLTPSDSDRFSQFIATFVEQLPQDSLLIILDEADQFVEEQLANYDRDREKSLSFRMMKELPTRVDRHGLPRVRVILSGYRVTHTREGVWANAGDVLRLVPLQESEAVEFIQGTLARIGVDITEHAGFIARRCGFQPAILIRFGQSLLNRLHGRRSSQQLGEYLPISSDDVAETFNDAAVIEEIRTVVSNNFQGNRVGGVLFDALLLAMQALPPGFPLQNAPQPILEKLREIEPDLRWLTRIDPTPEAEIKRNLRDFIARELLIEEPGHVDGEVYRLRFPHYLPVLTQQTDLPLTIKQRIHALMQTSPVRRRGGSILAESGLDTIRYWYDQPNTDFCQMVLVGGGWLTALENSKVGIADRLGCAKEQVCKDGKFVDVAQHARVYLGLDVPACINLVNLTTRPAVVLGGIDTLRWALHQQWEGSELLIETVPIQRITEACIAWWFEGARALHFESPDALARITAITGGIPFLLEQFDALLPHADGSEVTATDLRDVMAVFNTQFTSFAEELRSGAPSVRLRAREQELLISLALIAENGLFTRLGPESKDFRENWELCDTKNVMLMPPYEDPNDGLALRVLIGAGVLSVDDRQQAQLQAGGVEARLVQAWRDHAVG